MSEPFLAEVRLFGFNFPPRSWAQCDGQILPINQNQSLYALLGTTYGGDGRTTLGLPDLRGRAAAHKGNDSNTNNLTLGQKTGRETVSLSVGEMPSHTHGLQGTSANASSNQPNGNLWAKAPNPTYHTLSAGSTAELKSTAVSNTGNATGHENMHPFQAVNFCICLQGLFPSRN